MASGDGPRSPLWTAAGELGCPSIPQRLELFGAEVNRRRSPDIMSRAAARGRLRREKDVLVDGTRSPPEQPVSTSSLRRHVAELSMHYNRASEQNGRSLQPVSPTSYSSSMEVAAYKPLLTPTSSLDFKGRLAETSYSLKTSAELLKVLNRIWTLEEQHASNTALVRALKMELHHAQARIQELMQKHQSDQHEVCDLMKQLMEDKLIRRTKEQEKIQAAVQSVKNELQDERKLRRRSENLHRKLAKELRDVKTVFSKSLDELEKERKDRILLEGLCDKFAKVVGVYERDIRALRHKYEKDYTGTDNDKLIVHIAEAWLDGREQMKHADGDSKLQEETSVDKLNCEIEAFLTAKQGNSLTNEGSYVKNFKGVSSRHRHSLESINLNGAISASQDAGDIDSVAGDFHYPEINKINDVKDASRNLRFQGETAKTAADSDVVKLNKLDSQVKMKMKSHRSLQVELEGEIEIERSKLCDPNTMASIEERIPNDAMATSDGNKNKCDVSPECKDLTQLDAKDHPNNDRKKESGVISLRGQGHSTMNSGDNFPGAGFGLPSPVQQWSMHHASPGIIERSECTSSKGKKKTKNSLKAKLLEARLEGQNARLRGSNVK